MDNWNLICSLTKQALYFSLQSEIIIYRSYKIQHYLEYFFPKINKVQKEWGKTTKIIFHTTLQGQRKKKKKRTDGQHWFPTLQQEVLISGTSNQENVCEMSSLSRFHPSLRQFSTYLQKLSSSQREGFYTSIEVCLKKRGKERLSIKANWIIKIWEIELKPKDSKTIGSPS